MQTWIIVPALNEARSIERVIEQLRHAGYSNIVVVDDGSVDQTTVLAERAGVLVVTHAVNRGVGAATVTGAYAAFMHGAEAIVTFDADEQHEATDIAALLKPIEDGAADVVLGYRVNMHAAPFIRRVGNAIANSVTWLLAGVHVRDSQSGLRAYSKKGFLTMHLRANGYEFCSEVIREMKHRKLRFMEVPVQVRYSALSLSKGQNFDAGVGTFIKLIVRSLMR